MKNGKHDRKGSSAKFMGTTPAKDYTENQRIMWFGHLLHMNPE